MSPRTIENAVFVEGSLTFMQQFSNAKMPEAPGEIVVLAVRHEVSTAPVEFHLKFVALVVEAIGAGMPQSKVCEFRTWKLWRGERLKPVWCEKTD